MSDQQPKLSEDGKFYWDGQRWAPVPAKPGAGCRSAQNGPLGACCLITALAFVALIVLGFCGELSSHG